MVYNILRLKRSLIRPKLETTNLIRQQGVIIQPLIVEPAKYSTMQIYNQYLQG